MADIRRVAVAGLGSVGLRVARALDEGMDGLRLVAVAASSPESAARRIRDFRSVPDIVSLDRVADEADIVVECLPPAVFTELAKGVFGREGRTLVVASVGCLLTVPGILEKARASATRLIAPSGAVAGMDGLRAAREIGLESVRLTTRKPPASFGETVMVEGVAMPTASIDRAVQLFSGNARQSVAAFPKNVNVAATIALAGAGPEATAVELWADPSVAVNTHELCVRSRAGEMKVVCANLPDEANPRSSAITAFSIIAALRRLDAALTVGS
ncbi:aspartate dehydrogenase domain-containing protein [Nitratireductor aquibiodomus]|uniref:aspartate dehydrogenase domain-containing protein n=1 Tax=Nitratireductor aquibiodomus TaxID=204799 RepID=UPI00046AD1D5|nr:aspartate dehydrogenase domain-containing protein [Nitratireductor aquibiodomus]